MKVEQKNTGMRSDQFAQNPETKKSSAPKKLSPSAPDSPLEKKAKPRVHLNPNQIKEKGQGEAESIQDIRARERLRQIFHGNFEWRVLRFVRSERGDSSYVNIVNIQTGEILRSIPERTFREMSEYFDGVAGGSINISG